jgi:PAS domain S-box-containing protein
MSIKLTQIQKSAFNERLTCWGFRVGSVVVIILIFFLFFLAKRFLAFWDLADDTQSVLNKITSISLEIERSEAGYRGYLLSLDGYYLRRYHLAAESVHKDLKDLEEDLDGVAYQAESILKLKKGITDLYNSHDEILRDHDKLSQQAVLKKFLSMDLKNIRDAMENIELAEKQNLSDKKKNLDFLINSGIVVLVLGTMMSLALMIWSRRALARTAREAFTQNSLLNSIIENLTEGLIVVDKDGETLYFNSPLQKILGFPIDGVSLSSRKSFLTCYDPVTRRELSAEELPLAQALAGKTVSEFELIGKSFPTGREILLGISSRPILDSQGEIVGAMAIYEDISKRKHLEEEWQRAHDAALETSRLKSDFLAQMGHDIRTPMNGVMGMANVLSRTQLTAEQKTYVHNIEVSAHYLLSMIQNVMDQALLEKDQLKIEHSPFKLIELIEQTIALLKPMASEKHVQILVDSNLDQDLEVVSDSLRLQQVLLEPIQKGIKSVEQGFVSLKIRTLELFDGHARIHFEIKSSGSFLAFRDNFSNHLKSRLFQKTVDLLGGQFEFETYQNFGSRSSLTFDFQLLEGKPHQLQKAKNAGFKAKPVLVAEDQMINQMVIKKYLERLGLELKLVVDGQAAYEEVKTGRYSVVLMDCKMQPVDGYEATKMIRDYEKETGSLHTAIIALTADGTVEDRQKCEMVGMDDYIVKPIDLDKLQNLLQKWIKPVLKEEFLQKLEGYQLEGRPLIEVLTEDYFATAPEILSKLKLAVQNQDLKNTHYLAHTLKSTSITLGLVDLSHLCERIEKVPQIDQGVAKMLDDIQTAYEKGTDLLKHRVFSKKA